MSHILVIKPIKIYFLKEKKKYSQKETNRKKKTRASKIMHWNEVIYLKFLHCIFLCDLWLSISNLVLQNNLSSPNTFLVNLSYINLLFKFFQNNEIELGCFYMKMYLGTENCLKEREKKLEMINKLKSYTLNLSSVDLHVSFINLLKIWLFRKF